MKQLPNKQEKYIEEPVVTPLDIELTRRDFVASAAVTAGALAFGLPDPAEVQSLVERAPIFENYLIAAGTSEVWSFDKRAGKEVHPNAAAIIHNKESTFISKEKDPLLRSVMQVFDASSGDFIAQSFLVWDEKSGVARLVFTDHVIEKAITGVAGQFVVYMPGTLNFYNVRPNQFDIYRAYEDDFVDLFAASVPINITNPNQKDRFAVHLSYAVSKGIIKPFSGVAFRAPDEGEVIGVPRPDQGKLELATAIPMGYRTDAKGNVIADDISNTNLSFFTTSKPIICGGISGAPAVELYKNTNTPTGRVLLGPISIGGFEEGSKGSKDYYGLPTDNRGCVNSFASRPIAQELSKPTFSVETKLLMLGYDPTLFTMLSLDYIDRIHSSSN